MLLIRKFRKTVFPVFVFARLRALPIAAEMPRTYQKPASDVAERIRRLVEVETAVTISLGVASYQGSTGECESLIHSADAALYRAKREGRNRVVASTSS